MLCTLLVAFAPALQQSRPPVQITPSSGAGSPVVASDEELSAVAWRSALGEQLLLSVSDGRGLAWSAPMTVAGPPAGDVVTPPELQVDQTTAVILWADDRHTQTALAPLQASTPFVRTYDVSSGLSGQEFQLPLTTPLERTSVGETALGLQRVASGLRVHVALALTIHPVGAGPYGSLLLMTSNDGGQTFPTVVSLSPVSLLLLNQLQMQVEGDTVHVAWIDERDSTAQIYYQRSSDAGATVDFATEKKLTSGTDKWSFALDAVGSTLGVAYHDGITEPVVAQSVSALVSTDGGTTFNGKAMPGIEPFLDAPNSPAIAVAPSGASVTVAWSDTKGGFPPKVRTSRSVDGGSTWGVPQLVSQDHGTDPSLVASEPGRARMVVAWKESGVPYARVSLDEGARWRPAVPLASAVMYPFAYPRLAWNARYQNLIAGWMGPSAPYGVWAGGLRPQSITPHGFGAGSTQVWAQFGAFDDGSPLALFLVAADPGSLVLPFGDGRDLGLGFGPLLSLSLSAALGGTLGAPLDPVGDGLTAPLPVLSLPPGISLYAIGLSLDITSLTFGDISDVRRIDL